MKRDKQRAKKQMAGFSLVELLCAAVVFMVLGVIVAQMLSSATALTGMSNKKQEADAQGRLIFSRMALDIAKMAKREDVLYSFQKLEGNDRFAFLGEVAGYYPSSGTPNTLSVVSYRMGAGGQDQYAGLQRFSKGLAWADGAGQTQASFYREIGDLSPEALSSSQMDEYEEIGPGVIRFEFYFVLKDGSLSDVPWNAAAGSTAANGLADVASICIAIAVVDPAVMARVQPEDMRQLSQKLGDFSATGTPRIGDLESAWLNTVDRDPFAQKIGGSVRVLSRCFQISP